MSEGNVIRGLDAHIVFTIPIALGYSSRADALPVPRDKPFVLPDTMVFDQAHRAHAAGRAAVHAVLAARLLDIYDGKPEAKIPDQVLYALLRSRAVQEFNDNGERWFGVHPLVVDLLAQQGRPIPAFSGGFAGGSE